MKMLTTLLIMTLPLASSAQEIAGTVLDENKEPLKSASIQIYQGNALEVCSVTAVYGKYRVKPLEPGYYNVLVTHPKYDSTMMTGVIVAADQRTTLNFNMHLHDSKTSMGVRTMAYKKPFVDINPPACTLMTKEAPKPLPVGFRLDTLSSQPMLYQAKMPLLRESGNNQIRRTRKILYRNKRR